MTECKGTVLIVDDEESVRTLGQFCLEEVGYEIHTAASGDEALETFKAHSGIELAIVDVVMPRMSGPDLAERLRQLRPETKIIYTSGYGEGAGVALRRREEDATYLKKPFSPKDLRSTVEQLLFPGASSAQDSSSA